MKFPGIVIHKNRISISYLHDDVIKWKNFLRCRPVVWGIHRSPVNSPHKGQWRGALMFSLIHTWINVWVNKRKAGDLRRHRAHYDVIVMILWRQWSICAYCGVMMLGSCLIVTLKQTHNVIITSLLRRQNDFTMSVWRNNCVIITLCDQWHHDLAYGDIKLACCHHTT